MARRSALGLMAGAAALLTKTGASEAAFGDGANVFGKWDATLVSIWEMVTTWILFRIQLM